MTYGLDADKSLTSILNMNIAMLVRMIRTLVKGEMVQSLKHYREHTAPFKMTVSHYRHATPEINTQ